MRTYRVEGVMNFFFSVDVEAKNQKEAEEEVFGLIGRDAVDLEPGDVTITDMERVED